MISPNLEENGFVPRGRNGIAPRPVIDRLREKLSPNGDGCLVFTGHVDSKGYGRITAFTAMGKRSVLAHRIAYEAASGAIPEGLTIDHLCRNTRCCNPEHLEAVSLAENIRRRLAASGSGDALPAWPRVHRRQHAVRPRAGASLLPDLLESLPHEPPRDPVRHPQRCRCSRRRTETGRTGKFPGRSENGC